MPLPPTPHRASLFERLSRNDVLADNFTLIGFTILNFMAALGVATYTNSGSGFFLAFPVLTELGMIAGAFTALLMFLPRRLMRPHFAFLLNRPYFLNFLLMYALVAFNLMIFSSIKSLITEIIPFSWDQYFYQLDTTIHFGKTPQEWLINLYDHPLVFKILSFVYMLWLFMIYLYLMVWLIKEPRHPGRQELALGFVLTFTLLGNVFATIFSSAGPIFYHQIYPDQINPYADVFRQYSTVSAGSVIEFIQQALINLHQAGHGKFIQGISAFPSVHIGTSMLIAIHSYFYMRRAFPFLLVFLLMIFVSSFMLLWHYAVDAYFSILWVFFQTLILRYIFNRRKQVLAQSIPSH